MQYFIMLKFSNRHSEFMNLHIFGYSMLWEASKSSDESVDRFLS